MTMNQKYHVDVLCGVGNGVPLITPILATHHNDLKIRNPRHTIDEQALPSHQHQQQSQYRLQHPIDIETPILASKAYQTYEQPHYLQQHHIQPQPLPQSSLAYQYRQPDFLTNSMKNIHETENHEMNILNNQHKLYPQDVNVDGSISNNDGLSSVGEGGTYRKRSITDTEEKHKSLVDDLTFNFMKIKKAKNATDRQSIVEESFNNLEKSIDEGLAKEIQIGHENHARCWKISRRLVRVTKNLVLTILVVVTALTAALELYHFSQSAFTFGLFNHNQTTNISSTTEQQALYNTTETSLKNDSFLMDNDTFAVSEKNYNITTSSNNSSDDISKNKGINDSIKMSTEYQTSTETSLQSKEPDILKTSNIVTMNNNDSVRGENKEDSIDTSTVVTTLPTRPTVDNTSAEIMTADNLAANNKNTNQSIDNMTTTAAAVTGNSTASISTSSTTTTTITPIVVTSPIADNLNKSIEGDDKLSTVGKLTLNDTSIANRYTLDKIQQTFNKNHDNSNNTNDTGNATEKNNKITSIVTSSTSISNYITTTTPKILTTATESPPSSTTVAISASTASKTSTKKLLHKTSTKAPALYYNSAKNDDFDTDDDILSYN